MFLTYYFTYIAPHCEWSNKAVSTRDEKSAITDRLQRLTPWSVVCITLLYPLTLDKHDFEMGIYRELKWPGQWVICENVLSILKKLEINHFGILCYDEKGIWSVFCIGFQVSLERTKRGFSLRWVYYVQNKIRDVCIMILYIYIGCIKTIRWL